MRTTSRVSGFGSALWLQLAAALLISFLLRASSHADESVLPKLNTNIEPTNMGRITGYVYDALTGQPVKDAVVTVRHQGAFAEKGDTVDKTSESGKYECKGLIGRKSESINALGALSAILIGTSPVSTGKKTYRIDITSMPIRVSSEGYHAFEGIVQCRYRNPEGFRLGMQPILLMPTEKSEVSTAADTWGNAGLLSVVLSEPLVQPKKKVTLTAQIKMPSMEKGTDLKVISTCSLWKSRELKRNKDSVATDSVVYRTEFDAPKGDQLRVIPIEVRITECSYDLFPGGEARTVLLQVSPATDDSHLQERNTAQKLRGSGDNTGAQEILMRLCSNSQANLEDLRALAEVSDAISDFPTAATAWEKSVALVDDKARMSAMAAHARSLAQSGQYDAVVAQYAPVLEKVKPDKRPREIPLAMMVALGDSYIAMGRLEEADKLSREMIRWSGADAEPDVATFRDSLAEAQSSLAVEESPANPAAWADFGRALINQRRWEEAAVKLAKSLELDPNQPAVRSDLSYAMLHVGDRASETASLDEAIASAREATVILKGKKEQRSKDFFAWHTLGMLLYEKYCGQRSASDEASAETMVECWNALAQGLICSRQGKDSRDDRYWTMAGGFSSTTQSIEGFAYAEADSDFSILQSLRWLNQNPDDYLAHYQLAKSLYDLGRSDLAQAAVDQCGQLKSDFVDGLYLSALIARDRDVVKAKALLAEVVKANPRHPKANLTLSEILTEEGDTIGAAECLARHASFYGQRF